MRKILIALLAIFLVIQFFKPARNQSTAQAVNDITTKYAVPDTVLTILKRSCYDCHSNHTEYPWYSNYQPAAWWLDHHIKEGKRELNFSEFAAYAPKKADHKLEEVVEMIEKKEMPLDSYLWMHENAKLTASEAQLLMDWAKNLRTTIKL